MIKSVWRGHEIYTIDGDNWMYCDNGGSVRDNRECGRCGKVATSKEHDQCISDLKGVSNACCGHGKNSDAYIQFTNIKKKPLYGEEAVEMQHVLKNKEYCY